MPAAALDIRVVHQPVRYAEMEGFPTAAGAECVFLGRTRAESHPLHGELTSLEYHAYESMAEAVLQDLARRAVATYGCLFVRLHHAVGSVAVGEASVLVQTVCGHRDAAFDSCRWLIDSLKASAPIWKREVWAGGTTWSPGQPPPGGGTLRSKAASGPSAADGRSSPPTPKDPTA
jgi:molybdopterin synthase catalytic subunit